jgi:hypothetical protein
VREQLARFVPAAGAPEQLDVTVESQATLTDGAVILPKLFRRPAGSLQLDDGDPSLSPDRVDDELPGEGLDGEGGQQRS